VIDRRSSRQPEEVQDPDPKYVVHHGQCPTCRQEVILLPSGLIAPHQRLKRRRKVRCKGSGVQVATRHDSRYRVEVRGGVPVVVDIETGQEVYRR